MPFPKEPNSAFAPVHEHLWPARASKLGEELKTVARLGTFRVSSECYCQIRRPMIGILRNIHTIARTDRNAKLVWILV